MDIDGVSENTAHVVVERALPVGLGRYSSLEDYIIVKSWTKKISVQSTRGCHQGRTLISP